MPARWTSADIPDQHGRTVVITGANTGVGFATATALAERGAQVVLACRNAARGAAAAERIDQAVGARNVARRSDRSGSAGRPVAVVELDLASLDSVRAAAARIRAGYDRLDLLVNNAGLCWTPYTLTEDGFEAQFGVNHLGHFAFTGLLLDRLLHTPGSRVVTVTSLTHRLGTIDFDDLNSARRYRRGAAYARSKLANLLFSHELQRRLAAVDAETIALAAHPGASRTALFRTAPFGFRAVLNTAGVLCTQTAAAGALSVLRAGTDPGARGGECYGPGGPGQLTGGPRRVGTAAAASDPLPQARLWAVSERLTGVTPFGDRRTDPDQSPPGWQAGHQ